MDIKITMLNVRDGDAIVVLLKRSASDYLLILIDGGHGKDAPATIEILEDAAKSAGKKGPDLIICTHYDADHIGGLKKIAEHFKSGIGMVWLHKPHIVQKALRIASAIQGRSALILDAEEALEAEWLMEALRQEGLTEEGGLVLENWQDMAEFVWILDELNIKNKEPFSGDSYKDWPELKVLGPTKAFYKSRYDDLVKGSKLLLQEARAMRQEQLELKNKKENGEKAGADIQNPCKYLDEQDKDEVTATNQVSVILEIIAAKKKYFFTGDASIESFEAIPEYTTALKNVYWLKVAHHGSHNNSSSALFDIMKPKFADISGKNHIDNEVRDCLRDKGAKVRTTLDEQSNLIFPY